MHEPVNKMHSNIHNNNALPYEDIDNSGQEITQAITDKEKLSVGIVLLRFARSYPTPLALKII